MLLRWLSNLSFSFLIFGAYLLVRVYQWQQGKAIMPGWQVWLYVFGGALCLALGAQGIKERHRRLRNRY